MEEKTSGWGLGMGGPFHSPTLSRSHNLVNFHNFSAAKFVKKILGAMLYVLADLTRNCAVFHFWLYEETRFLTHQKRKNS